MNPGTPGNYRATFIRGYPWTWQVDPTTKSLGLLTLSVPFVRIGTDAAQRQRFCQQLDERRIDPTPFHWREPPRGKAGQASLPCEEFHAREMFEGAIAAEFAVTVDTIDSVRRSSNAAAPNRIPLALAIEDRATAWSNLALLALLPLCLGEVVGTISRTLVGWLSDR